MGREIKFCLTSSREPMSQEKAGSVAVIEDFQHRLNFVVSERKTAIGASFVCVSAKAMDAPAAASKK
jgi:hypothetical protein